MAALGRNDQFSQQEDAKTEVSGESPKLTSLEHNEIEPSRNDVMEIYNIWRTADNSQAQLNRPDGVS